MLSVQLVVFGVALGFAISAVISNVFQMVAALDEPVTSDGRRLAVLGLLFLAGPHILFSAGRKSLIIGDWPLTYVGACFALCGAWAFALGFVVIETFIW